MSTKTNHTTDNEQGSMSAVLALALAAFVFNTTEFAPIALLSDIGASFALPASQTGVMMTMYAWIVALMSLPVMLLTAKVERKKLLLGVFLLFFVGHMASYWAPSFGWLLFARALIALAHACFWSIGASLAARLAPAGKQTKAVGLLATGSALAMALGLPLGRVMGQVFDWRVSFAAIGFLALAIAACLFVLLPKLPAKNAGSLKSLPDLLGNAPLLLVYAIVALMVSAHFTAYSYIEPFVRQAQSAGAYFATLALFVFGAAGIAAGWLFGRFYDRLGNVFLAMGFVGLLASLLLLAPLLTRAFAFAALVFLWGVSMTCVVLSLQMKTLAAASSYTDVAMSLFSGIFNIGIGAGSTIGALVIASASVGAIGYAGALVLLLAIGVFAWGWRAQKI